jgi:AraC-like DNA-binding protein
MMIAPIEIQLPDPTPAIPPLRRPLKTVGRIPLAPPPLQLWRLQRVVLYIEAHLADQVTLLEMSEAAGFSPMHFAGLFRLATGVRPHEYVLRRKIEEAQLVLLTSDMPIVEVALSFGFLSQAHFTTVFKRFVGSPPLRWQYVHQRQIRSAVFRLRKLRRVQFPVNPAPRLT